MASSDPKTVSPTLSFPPRRGYLRQEPLAPSQSVLRTMLWRGAQCLLPLPGLGQNTPSKAKAPFSSCLCGTGGFWVSPLPWDTPYMSTSSCLIVCHTALRQIDLYICLALPPFFLRETKKVWQNYAHPPKIPNGTSAAMGSCRRGSEQHRSCRACSAPLSPCLVHPQRLC